ncbi:protein ARV1 [Ceratina calcarata]|uniref:Protein ARV n=1 Tax=Ceratina calcarata TaxID=156304 RepID=A0AAJ7S665_9HYME|nr:protein ARV1 [Ceratina calcarata]XP_026672205.1 protein ARV1 [Ceratina calcarata]XP_026672206.1 protein ARV1 [Ceratina calcarata]XP_026672207.1 protein ARV1 [Ceratina calcarata]XP_026672208.1 protein ARV1 [Ceratina calcarata]XP_026672209.1 protein ARV1 [Ceratina calcarata]XP_026672210.1 protein ARV1 [Ceratina calcarata]XP_026672211.1 protein ARV1 [Ceratina calcarata]
MYQCVNCGTQVEELYRQYSPNVLKLLKCETCGHLADMYIEYDPVIILVDLLLLEKRAYRHLLYNCDLKACWKLVIILWLVESFRNLYLCDNENNNEYIQSWRSLQRNLDAHCNLYLILFKTAIALAAFVAVVILLTKVKWYFYPTDRTKCDVNHLTKGLIIGGSGKLLGLLEIIWGHIFSAPHYFLILGYTLLCLFTVYSVVSNNRKLESLIILGTGITVYSYTPDIVSATLKTLQFI